MKGYIANRSFKHGRQYMKGDPVDINQWVNKDLESRGLIRWVERPEIINPDVAPKPKKRGRKSKK